MVVIYMDDLIITGDGIIDIDEVKLLLKQKFEMKDFGRATLLYEHWSY